MKTKIYLFSIIFLFIFVASPTLANSYKNVSVTHKVPVLTGGEVFTAFELNLTNSNHTGAGNAFYGFRIPDMVLDPDAIGVAFSIGQGWSYGLHLVTNLPIIFGPVPGGPMLYFDGTPKNGLSLSDRLTVYGDISVTDHGIKEFNVLAIKEEDLSPGFCNDGEARIDVGGFTKERCQCLSNEWYCVPLRQGPVD